MPQTDAKIDITQLPIVDAHQHFWDLKNNYLPWLCDEPPIPFRYGDYSAIRKNYLPDRLSARQRQIPHRQDGLYGS